MNSVRFHLTNIAGVGAIQLMGSLLPALERIPNFNVNYIFLPDRGALSYYHPQNPFITTEIYHRTLPNSISRIIECTIGSKYFDSDVPIIVFGDLPLRCKCPQIVFVQQSNLLPSQSSNSFGLNIKYWIARKIFAFNRHCVDSFIVQTDLMRQGLEQAYPDVKGKVHVIPQPVPSWLLDSGLRRKGLGSPNNERLQLIYPAASYPHKNHSLLSHIETNSNWPVNQLVLTINSKNNPSPHLPWIQCVGHLSPEEMLDRYSTVDALLFLSKEESYGFPLLEAMFIGLPIVCPNLPYARTLCGVNAIYFDPNDSYSLLDALQCLLTRLNNGWWPNWSEQLSQIPSDWQTVAKKMLELTCRS